MLMADCLPQIVPVKKESVLRGDNALVNADVPMRFSFVTSRARDCSVIITSLH